MTPIILLERLEEFVKEKTSDIKLQVRVRKGEEGTKEKERAAFVYKMNLPTKDDQTEQVPYILLQILNGKDDQTAGEPAEAVCAVRIVVVTYSEDAGVGAYDVLNLILRIKSELEKAGVIGDQFALDMPLEYIIYPDNTPPYYIGEMITNWSLPTITREVEELWQ